MSDEKCSICWEIFPEILFHISQVIKMLSIYLDHIIGFSSKVFRTFSSKSAMNKQHMELKTLFQLQFYVAVFFVFFLFLFFFFYHSSKFCKGVTWDLSVIPQFRKSLKRSQTFTMWNVRVKTNNINSTQNCSLR